jgi:hypothetical protein
MPRRPIVVALCAAVIGLSLTAGCDSGGPTHTTPEAHDQDTQAGHMVHPAGGPNSPEAKAAAKKTVAPVK